MHGTIFLSLRGKFLAAPILGVNAGFLLDPEPGYPSRSFEMNAESKQILHF